MIVMTTKSTLENQIKFLNKQIATRTHELSLDWAYGGVRLVLENKKRYTQADLSRRLSKPELYEVLYALTNVLRTMKYDKGLRRTVK